MRWRAPATRRRIARLEREVLPQTQPELYGGSPWETKRRIEHELFFGPGEIWQVEDPIDYILRVPPSNHTQIILPNVYTRKLS